MKNILFIFFSLSNFLFFTSCESPNNPVELLSLDFDRNFAYPGETVKLVCNANDADNDNISFIWEAPAGELTTFNDTAIWIAPDSIGHYYINCIVSDENGTSDGDIIKIFVVDSGVSISGKVKNAITGLGERGIKVSINELKIFTNKEGEYTLYVPDFLNSYEIISKKKSFCEDTTFLNIPSNYSASIFVHNFSIIPIPQSGEKRIVLTWGPNPADMDAHLLTPAIDSINYHIFHSNRGNAETAPFTVLNVDETRGFGPETITIKKLEIGTYVYYVHRYSNFGNIIESQAKVQILNNSCINILFEVPQLGEGQYWHVFELDGGNGVIKEINEIIDSVPEVQN